MKKALLGSVLVLLSVFSGFPSKAVFAQEKCDGKNCTRYSDDFDLFNIRRWQAVLIYSRQEGIVTVKNGRLMLKAPKKNKPVEINVYSLFTFENDFDIQIDYDVSDNEEMIPCRFNAGIVLQTLGDEKSYKCYVASEPGKSDVGFFYRARLDRSGENKLEKFKGDAAPQQGSLRVTRKAGRITFWVPQMNDWKDIYDFQMPCAETLRMRFKLGTGDEKEADTCPALVKFDNFIVNSCDMICNE